MSVNHLYSSNLHETHWWMESSTKTTSPSHQQTLLSSSATNAAVFRAKAASGEESTEADDGGDQATSMEFAREEEEMTKKPLFEKPLTPSDVGKLNRLVIPKQHAENYFPLNGGGGGGDSGEKGSLLSFEDEVGKSWRFRYSYWNSSQSYVLTKGWSRFVKEKRLDAGDIVVFTRHRGDAGRFFIGWRRRNNYSGGGVVQESGVAQPPFGGGGGGWVKRVYYDGYPHQRQHEVSSSLPYQPDCRNAIAGSVIEKQTKAAIGGNSKRLRLFGVNLELEAGSDDHHKYN